MFFFSRRKKKKDHDNFENLGEKGPLKENLKGENTVKSEKNKNYEKSS